VAYLCLGISAAEKKNVNFRVKLWLGRQFSSVSENAPNCKQRSVATRGLPQIIYPKKLKKKEKQKEILYKANQKKRKKIAKTKNTKISNSNSSSSSLESIFSVCYT